MGKIWPLPQCKKEVYICLIHFFFANLFDWCRCCWRERQPTAIFSFLGKILETVGGQPFAFSAYCGMDISIRCLMVFKDGSRTAQLLPFLRERHFCRSSSDMQATLRSRQLYTFDEYYVCPSVRLTITDLQTVALRRKTFVYTDCIHAILSYTLKYTEFSNRVDC